MLGKREYNHFIVFYYIFGFGHGNGAQIYTIDLRQCLPLARQWQSNWKKARNK